MIIVKILPEPYTVMNGKVNVILSSNHLSLVKDLTGKHFLLGKIKTYCAKYYRLQIINRFKNNLDKFMDERLSSIQKLDMCLLCLVLPG